MNNKNGTPEADIKKCRVNILDSFNNGARMGLKMSFNSMMPGLVFAFALMQILTITNLINYIEIIFRPIMMLVGLPGITAPALLFGFISTGGGLGIAANLFANGQIDTKHVAMLLAGIMCLGASMQYMGRILGLIEVNTKFYPVFVGLNIIASLLAITMVRVLI